ncbi:hypothetical protein [Pararhodobacter zhoushanensis]|uniref:hypothetical protein n=1 Tax=Pararhodobacter zhoushanensis TaxID=2479545 RepID=UPI0013E032CD|nr:hypothetical protein [Pararhodobacter zhoushanensis]
MNSFPSTLAAILGVLAIAACTTPIRNQTYTATSAAQIPESQARAECQFAVEAATASIGTNRVPRGTSFDQEIADAIADGVMRGDEQNTLFVSCMRSKGFVGG